MTPSEPIVIAQIMGKMNGGGVESVIMNYYRHIDHDRFQFDFICDEDSIKIPYKEIEELGGKVIICPSYKKIFRYIHFLINLFKQKKYIIVHSNLNTLSVFPLHAAKKAGVPIRIAHSHSTSNPKEPMRNLLKVFLRQFSKHNATHYFSCSKKAGEFQFGKKAMQQGQVTIIPNAIETELFSYNTEKRINLRKTNKIDGNAFIIGHIGRFCKTKNHLFLLKVFKEIHKINHNSFLVLVGQGPLENKIISEAKKQGLKDSIRFLGQRTDANELYSCFDVFCLPSLYEGLPVVGVEAQANGLPCIFSNAITKESKVLESTVFLANNVDLWTDAILHAQERSKWKIVKRAFKQAGLDIKDGVSCLEKEYERLYRAI